jgi:hypothetical protein
LNKVRCDDNAYDEHQCRYYPYSVNYAGHPVRVGSGFHGFPFMHDISSIEVFIVSNLASYGTMLADHYHLAIVGIFVCHARHPVVIFSLTDGAGPTLTIPDGVLHCVARAYSSTPRTSSRVLWLFLFFVQNDLILS